MSVETVVFDAGGRYGVHPTWRNFGGELTYIMFEPDQEESKRLAQKYYDDARIRIEACALGETHGESLIHVLSHRGQSSMFSPNLESNWFKQSRPGEGEETAQYVAQVTTIDKYSSEHDIRPDFLKSDTEGSEMLVLRGAEQQLKYCLGLRCETQFEQVFHGAPTFDNIFAHLTQRGFLLLNLDYNGMGSTCNKYFVGAKAGFLTGTDATWIRKPQEVLSWPGTADMVATRVAKYSVFCFLNGASDVAMHMLRMASSCGYELKSLEGTKLFANLDVLVQKLFYQLLQHPAYSRSELQEIYSKIFDRPLKRCHEFFESTDFNPA